MNSLCSIDNEDHNNNLNIENHWPKPQKVKNNPKSLEVPKRIPNIMRLEGYTKCWKKLKK